MHWSRSHWGVVALSFTLSSLLSVELFGQEIRQYEILRTASPPTIDGVVSPGEWDGVVRAGEWKMLREPGRADQHNWAFAATWDDSNLYLLITTDYSDWVLGVGSEFEEPEDCFGGVNCGGTDFGGNPDSVNLYLDPNVAGLGNLDTPNGYQFAFGLNEGLSMYMDGAITNTFVFQEAHAETAFGNNGGFGEGDFEGHTQWSFVSQVGQSGGVVEMVFPWQTFDAPNESVLATEAPDPGHVWYSNIGIITSDPGNFLPIWNFNDSQSFVTRPDGEWVFSSEFVDNGLGPDGDVNGDGTLDASDIDELATAIRNGATDSKFDLNGDGAVSPDDHATLVNDLLGTYYGDSNLDGEFNSGDFVFVFSAGQYEDAIQDNSGWADGDWNGDADFDSSDFVTAFQSGGYEQGPRAAVAAVPEPSGVALLLIAMLGLAKSRRR